MAIDAYKITPAERRARAERLKASREKRNAFATYTKEVKDAQRKRNSEIERAKIEEENERKSQNFLVRGLHTVGNVLGNVVEGAAKGVEGIVDLGAGAVGAIGGLFSDDFQDGVQDFIETDWVGSTYGEWLDDATKYSYTNDGAIGDVIEGVASGVGQMLPAVAAAAVTGGTSIPSSLVSIGTMGASATGNATEQAYQDGAGFYEGLGYGFASGGVEMATEKLTGGMGKVFGAGLLDDVGESVAKTGIRRVAKNAVGEAGEEVIAELANPALKTIYKGSDALNEYKEADYWKGIAEAGAVGGLTSMAYSGTVGYGLAKKGIGYVGKDADVNASLEAIDDQRRTAAEFDAADKLTADNETKFSDNILANYRNIEKTLKSASESKRADLISKFSLDKAFDTDGSMNADFTASLTAQSDFDKRYYSYNMRGNEAVISSDLEAITANERSKNPNAENVTVFAGELSETGKSNYTKLKKAFNYLNKRSGKNISLTITNPSETFNGLLLDDSKMYISADTLDSGTFAGTVVHEYMHVAEGSAQYNQLMKFLGEDSSLVETAKKSVLGKAYDISADALDVIQQKIDNGTELSERESEIYNLYQSELGAHMVENLLGNEDFIDRLVRENKGLAGTILNKIYDLIGSFKSMGDATSKEEYKRLKQAEWMYLYAVEKAGYKYVNGRIEEDDEEDVDSDEEIQYNRTKNVKYISYEKVGMENIRFIRGELVKLYENKDGVADGIAIANGNKVYIVDSGCENGDIDFGVRKIRTIKDSKLRDEYIRRNNNESISKGYISDGLFGKFGDGLYNHRGSNRRQQTGTELQTDSRESEHNQKRVSGENADNGGLSSDESGNKKRKIRYSLKHDINGDIFVDVEDKKISATDTAKDIAHILSDIVANKFFDYVDVNGQKIGIKKKTAKEWQRSRSAQDLLKKDSGKYIDKMNAFYYADELIQASRDFIGEMNKHIRKDSFVEFARGTVNFKVDENGYSADIIVGTTRDGKALLYDLVGIKDKKIESAPYSTGQFRRPETLSTDKTVSQDNSSVNTNSTQDSENNSTKIQSSLKDTSEKTDYRLEKAFDAVYNMAADYASESASDRIEIEKKMRNRKYTQTEAEALLNDILSDYYLSDEKIVGLKNRGTLVDSLYEAINDSKAENRTDVSLAIADIIVENAFAENILQYDTNYEKIGKQLSVLKSFKNKIDTSGMRDAIRSKYGRSPFIYTKWSTKNNGMDIKAVKQALAEQGIKIEAEKDADILFEIDDLFTESVDIIRRAAAFQVDSVISKDNLDALRQSVAKSLLPVFDSFDPVKKEFKNYKRQSAKKLKEIIETVKLQLQIVSRLYKLKDVKSGVFTHASQAENDSLKLIRDTLPKILRNGNINKRSTRKILSELSKWYTDKNEMLSGFYNSGIRESIEYFMTVEDNKGELTLSELKELDKILQHFNYILSNHNRIWRNNRYEDAMAIAKDNVENAKKAKEMHSKNGWMRFAKSKAIRFFSDPLSVFRQLDGYNPNGFFTTAFNEIRDGIIKSGMAKIDINSEYDAFYAEKGNKKYINDLMNDKYTVKIGEHEISKAVAIGLYMTSKTGKALDTLTQSGWYLQKKVKGKEGNGVTKIPMPTVTPEMLADMYAQFDKRDIRLMEIIDKAYKKCGEYKAQTDNIKYGFTNVMEGTYYPLRRIHADNVDSDDMAAEMDRVSNASFNKSRVENAKNGFIIENALNVFTRHTAAVANYYGLSIPVENFNRLWNLDTSGSDIGARMPISVKTVYDSFDGGASKYVRDLIEDVQGLSSRRDIGNAIVSFIRGNYAKYQLGANPKVWLTQGSSYVAAFGKIDFQSLSKGFGIRVSAEEVSKYCDVAALRKYDGGVAKAMSVTENAGNFLMKTIGDVDNLIVRRLFGACQVEAKRRFNLEIGTEENKVKAGELLREVILDTQQSAMATEWSAAMRSNSEIIKSFTMFGADSMKACSRFIDAVGEFTSLRTQLKDAKNAEKVDTDLVNRLEKQVQSAAKNIGKQTATICSIAVYMTAISELMRFLLNKEDEEDESAAKRVTLDTVGNIVGMVPIVRDIYSFFADGYDIDNYAYSAVNDMLTAFKDCWDVMSSAVSGEVTTKQDIAKMLRKLLYAAGQASGLPTRNFYNYITGIIRRFDEDTAYQIDSLFYKAEYKKDLAKAIEEGDDEMADTIMNMMLAGSGEYSSGTAKAMKDLYSKGYDCLPKSVKDTVTVDGVEYTLTNKQYESFKDIYGEANKKVDAVVSSGAFASADDKTKAKMIKFVYDAYYDIARADVVDVDTSSRNALFSEAIDISVLAQVVAQAQSLTADTDKNGKTVSGSKKKKVQQLVNSLRLTAVQKYMIMGYLGYTNKNGAQAVKSYINRLSLSSAEKDLLYKYSGYAA